MTPQEQQKLRTMSAWMLEMTGDTPAPVSGLPSGQTIPFPTIDPTPAEKKYPTYTAPPSDATDAVTGKKIEDRYCCTRADGDHVRDLLVLLNKGLPTKIGKLISYQPNAQGVDPGTLGREPFGFWLEPAGVDRVWFCCQTYIEATMAKGIGAPYTTDSAGQVHFTPAAPWEMTGVATL